MKKASLTFLMFFTFLLFLPLSVHSADKRSVTVKSKDESTILPYSTKYYAIIIGNNHYKHLPKLKTAIVDAKSVDEILKNQYGFQTKLLIDATRKDILSTINDFRKRLGEKDSLLIYYAGHGTFEKEADKAYWLPVDAQRDDPVDWIIADDITSNIKRIASRYILIVSDSCYSGTLTRDLSAELKTKGEREEFIEKMLKRPSRSLMASGGNEPVADEGGGGHSVFAGAFLKALSEADKGIFTAEELFHGRIKAIVAGKSDQVPEYKDIKNSGHEGGDFVFQLASVASITSPSMEVGEEMKRLEEEKERLKKEREELEQKKALIEEKNRLEEERKKLEKEKLEVASLLPPPPIDQPKSRLVEKDGMVLIPAGEFMAGYSGSLKGMVLNAFYIDKYEVTQWEFRQVMGNNPSQKIKCDNCPVDSVSWYEADEYCREVGKRLPTEWEWEKAAKAGTTTSYYWGESKNMGSDYAWYTSETHPVGQKKPNNYGLYDMLGNVEEWTSTDYDGDRKVFRGAFGSGTWYRDSRLPRKHKIDVNMIGFRCASDSER